MERLKIGVVGLRFGRFFGTDTRASRIGSTGCDC